MAESSLSEQWQHLCDEFQAAKDAHDRASGIVIRKFSAIGAGRSRENPTEAELDEFDHARDALEEVKRRMDEFVERHTGIRRQRGGSGA